MNSELGIGKMDGGRRINDEAEKEKQKQMKYQRYYKYLLFIQVSLSNVINSSISFMYACKFLTLNVVKCLKYLIESQLLKA